MFTIYSLQLCYEFGEYIEPISSKTVVILKIVKGFSGEEPKTQVLCHGCFLLWLVTLPPTPKWVIKDDHSAHTINTII